VGGRKNNEIKATSQIISNNIFHRKMSKLTYLFMIPLMFRGTLACTETVVISSGNKGFASLLAGQLSTITMSFDLSGVGVGINSATLTVNKLRGDFSSSPGLFAQVTTQGLMGEYCYPGDACNSEGYVCLDEYDFTPQILYGLNIINVTYYGAYGTCDMFWANIVVTVVVELATCPPTIAP
jgi:hypothetical protein